MKMIWGSAKAHFYPPRFQLRSVPLWQRGAKEMLGRDSLRFKSSTRILGLGFGNPRFQVETLGMLRGRRVRLRAEYDATLAGLAGDLSDGRCVAGLAVSAVRCFGSTHEDIRIGLVFCDGGRLARFASRSLAVGGCCKSCCACGEECGDGAVEGRGGECDHHAGRLGYRARLWEDGCGCGVWDDLRAGGRRLQPCGDELPQRDGTFGGGGGRGEDLSRFADEVVYRSGGFEEGVCRQPRVVEETDECVGGRIEFLPLEACGREAACDQAI